MDAVGFKNTEFAVESYCNLQLHVVCMYLFQYVKIDGDTIFLQTQTWF